jgi:hypothetical protein
MKLAKAKKGNFYVWRFIQLNRSRAAIFLTLFLLAVMLFIIGIRPYASLGLIMIPLSYALGLYAYRCYLTWNSGPQGEGRIMYELKKLNDDYVLVKNAIIPPSRGDIDYVLAGPTGVFAIEAKNLGGIVSCDGDFWTREKIGRSGRPYPLEIGSPSRQVKRSAKTLKDFILRRRSSIFGKTSPHIWVYGILVFVNKDSVLRLKNPTVEILDIGEINRFVSSRRDIRLSKSEVAKIAEYVSGRAIR